MKKENKIDSGAINDNRMKKMQECYDTSKIKVKNIKDPFLKADIIILLTQMNNILTDYNKSKPIIKSEPKTRENLKSELINLNKVIDGLKKKFGNEAINEIIGSCC